MDTTQIFSLGLIAAGIGWAVWQSRKPSGPVINSPQRATRVQVFADLDRLRLWFESDQNPDGAEAIKAATTALVAKPLSSSVTSYNTQEQTDEPA